MPEPSVTGIHHVTAIAGDPQENVDFYADLLGLRMVKRSVNQDDPGTYHFFYADAVGHPGTDLTFFPWPGMGPGRNGTGLTNEVVFAAPTDSLDYWLDRLERAGLRARLEARFGEKTLTFHDVHGLGLAITGTSAAASRAFEPWRRSPVPPEHQLRGIHAVRVVEMASQATRQFATETFGMTHTGQDGRWDRYAGSDAASGFLDVVDMPSLPRGQWGVGTVHHVAWRVADDAHQARVQDAVRRTGISTTPVIDRFWFHSVYFREPGGVLFELATDGPGFGVDEDMEALGEMLVLPPWLEPQRADIERALPPIELPHARAGDTRDARREVRP